MGSCPIPPGGPNGSGGGFNRPVRELVTRFSGSWSERPPKILVFAGATARAGVAGLHPAPPTVQLDEMVTSDLEHQGEINFIVIRPQFVIGIASAKIVTVVCNHRVRLRHDDGFVDIRKWKTGHPERNGRLGFRTDLKPMICSQPIKRGGGAAVRAHRRHRAALLMVRAPVLPRRCR